MAVDTQINLQALLKDENVKEEIAETNTEDIDKIKMGSNKICIRDDVAKENMVFSQECSQAVFNMGNIEEMQDAMPIMSTLKGTILCARGKHIRPDQEMIRRQSIF